MLVEAQGITKHYAMPRGTVAALDGIDLDIEAGEFLAVCGRSGSGKSTLLAVLGGLCRPTAGVVRIDGTDLGTLGPAALAEFRARRFGFMFQFTGLLPNLRAADNVALPALLAGMGYREAYTRARNLLAQVELAKRWDAYPGELSGGEQRRVALARALVNRPVLLLADEPTNDLDEAAEREMLGLLREMARAHNTTLIVVTHEAELARQAGRVVTLRNGRLDGETVSPLAPVVGRVSNPSADEPGRVGNPSYENAASVPALDEPVPLGAGLGRFVLGFAGWVLVVASGLWGIDYLTARVQRQEIAEKQEQRKHSQHLALQQLRADVDDVCYLPDGAYELGLYLSNADAEQPFHVLGPAARVFVQVNQTWQEVSAHAVGFEERDVRAVAGRQVYRFVFRADLPRFDELIRGYMHVRITNTMLVSDKAEPTDDIFSRTDDYYVYLKPQNLSDNEVRKRNGWKPGSLVPRWIPMPAH